MSARAIFDLAPSNATTLETPAFPWARYDAGRFILEEALLDGNLASLHTSAMAQPGSRERLWGSYARVTRALDRRVLHAFELEIDGQWLCDHWVLEGQETRTTPDGFTEARLTLREAGWPVRVTVCTQLDGSAFLERWLEIENRGTASLAISRLAPWCGLFLHPADVAMMAPAATGYALGRYRHLSWGMEGDFAWESLPVGTLRETATQLMKFAPRFFLARNEETSEIAVLDIEYTGGIGVDFTRIDRHGVRALHVRVELADGAPLRVLDPGETLASPRVHLSLQYGDEDACANALFTHLRRAVLPARPWPQPHPVGYHYGGYIQPHWIAVTPEIIRKEVDLAALFGAELFTVDAGWNVPPGRSYTEVFGDWWETPLLREQLRDCFDYARAKGLGAALWTPIEILGPAAQTLAAHPDWLLREGERPVQMLDLAQPAVEQYVFDTIAGLIERYDLACFRIDGGPEQFARWEGVHDRYRESRVWRYYEALYRIFERVRAAYPRVALENCWGGGGRIDLGMMRRFHWVQFTDNWHPEEQLRILDGLTLSLPPEQCLSFVGAINTHQVDLDFSIRAGLFGHFNIAGAAPASDKLNDEMLARWQHAVALYKTSIRPLLDQCAVFHHAPRPGFGRAGEWVGLEYAAADGLAAVAGIFRLGDSRDDTFTFKARGLDIARDYDVRFDNLDRHVTVSGLRLRTDGLPIRLPGKMTSELLVLRALAE